MKKRSIYCGACKLEKGPGCENDSRCKSCKSDYEKNRRIKKRLAEGKPATRPERDAKCNACKDKKAQGISVSCRCNRCVSIANKERLHAKRKETGLPDIPIRDSSYCHICDIPKTDGRCIPCRRRMARERKAKKREEAGKRPWGSGRPLTCYLCNSVKERPKASYCNTCQREDNKRRWAQVIAPKINIRQITLICECGKEKKSTRKLYCDDCLLRRKRASTSEAQKRRRKQFKEAGYLLEAVPLTDEQKARRIAARNYLNSLIRKGLIKREGCYICGEMENVEAHHDDYSKPLEVEWLCKKHHAEHHRYPTFK